jgi:O-antigen/teichoic acid export membrane protein
MQNRSDIAQLETQTGIEAVRPTLPTSHFYLEAPTLSEQPTWILPVIPGSLPLPTPTFQDAGEQSQVAIIRGMVKSSAVYALSSLASPLLSLLLVPFLVYYLPRDDYGALVILNIFIALIAGVTQLGMGDAFFRTYNLNKESIQNRVTAPSTLLLLLTAISIPITLGMVTFSPWLAIALLNNATFSDAFKVVAAVVLLQNLSIPGMAWLRAESRSVAYTVLSLCNLLVNGGLTICLVAVLHKGLMGSLIATACGYAVIVFITVPAILLRARLKCRLTIARDLLIVGSPHVINLLSGWVLQLIDRYLLGRLGSLSQTASYSVAYSLGGVLSAVIITPFSMVWWATIYSIAKKERAERIFRLIFRWFSIVLLFATFGLALAGIGVLDLFFPLSYHSVAPVIPVIALSTMFSGIYVIFSLGISLYGKTWIASLLITCAALLNVLCNLLLIPHYGSMGAAIATLVAYFMLVVASYFVNLHLYPVKFEIGLFALALAAGIILYAGSELLSVGHVPLVAWGIHVSALLFYSGYLLLMGMFPSRKL